MNRITNIILLLLVTIFLVRFMPKPLLRGLRRAAVAAALNIPFLRRALLGAFLH
ncbi:hypothetical protein [Salibacterium sp. K-3]